jgi:hypothetical protein
LRKQDRAKERFADVVYAVQKGKVRPTLQGAGRQEGKAEGQETETEEGKERQEKIAPQGSES